jgi:hypothetical protein
VIESPIAGLEPSCEYYGIEAALEAAGGMDHLSLAIAIVGPKCRLELAYSPDHWVDQLAF